MSNENEADILDSLDSLAKLAGLIRIVIGGAIVIGTVLVGVGGWVWTINAATSSHGAQLEKIVPSVRTLETWRATYDVEKYTAREAATLEQLEDPTAVPLNLTSNQFRIGVARDIVPD